MKKENISDALSGVDADIIEEAEARRAGAQLPAAAAQAADASSVPAPARKKHTGLVFGIVSGVAVAAAAVAGVIFVPKLMGQNGIETSEQPGITTTAAQSGAQTGEQTGTTGIPGTDPDDGPAPEQGGVKRGLAYRSVLSRVERISDDETADRGIFKLKMTTGKNMRVDELKEHIKLTAINAFTIDKQSDNEFTLRSEKPVAPGVIIKLLALDDDGNVCDSWAFESEQKFAVNKVYPEDGAAYVGYETGIEITFTEAPLAEDIDENIDISPYVDGYFEVRGKTAYFIPDEGFEFDKKYTVTVIGATESVSGKELGENYVFSFNTGGEYSDTPFYTRSSSSGFSESFLPADKACIQVELSYELRESFPEFDTHLYRFAGADDYYAAMKKRAEAGYGDDGDTDVSGLTEVFSSNERPFAREGSFGTYILLPDELDAGYYVAEIKIDGSQDKLQYLLEVSPLSVYAMSLGEENIFFVNSSETGKPASGASVTLEVSGKKYTGKVGSDGIVKINTAGESGRAVLDIDNGGSRYIDCAMLSGAKDLTFRDLYYTYIHTDRVAYLPTDTIRVWGAVIPRAYGTPLPEGLSLKLSDSEYKDITLSTDGTFSAEIKIKDHAYAWQLSLVKDDETLTGTYIIIKEYQKPQYVLDIDMPDYAVFPQEESVPITLKASYYEGTPAEGVMLKDGYNYDSDDVLITGKDGTVRTDAIYRYDNEDWKLSTASYSYNLTGIEDTYIYVGKSVPAFYRDVMLKTDYDEDKKEFKLNTYKMDFSRMDEFLRYRDSKRFSNWYYSDKDDSYDKFIKGAPSDTYVDIEVIHHWTERTQVDSYYDYIEKKNVPIYTFESQQAQVATYRVNCKDGYTIKNFPIDDPNGYYDIKITYKDSDFRTVKETITLYAKGHKEDSDIYYYRVGSGTKMFMLDSEEKDDSTSWYGSELKFTENETKKLRLVCSNDGTAINGQLMLAVYKSDFVSYEVKPVTDSTVIELKGTKDLIPNACYAGAYFDGTHVYRIVSGSMRFDPSEREIILEAESDSGKYDAGDTVKLTVKATDSKGNALENAKVHLSLVDEAAFAVEEQYADILGDIYAEIWYPSVTEYISYIQHFGDDMNDGAKGGGEAEPVRRDFRDTAFFDSAVTDSSGIAVFEIKMPDNLTTWRATLLALYDDGSERLYAGTAKTPVVTTRALFITPIMQKQFIEGDDIAVSANCAGLGDGKISVTITGSGTEQTKSIYPKETANFGKLKKGSYIVTFKASNANGSDAVEMPLTVTDTLLETYIFKGAEVSELSGIAPTKFPISISFFDKEYMFCTDILYSLLGYSGRSLDMRMASAFAAQELGYITNDELVNEFIGETAEGFARQLPAASQDNEITALMCAALPEAVNRHKAIDAFYDDLQFSDAPMTDICMDYMALAALGEPVLSDIQALYNSGKVETAESGIYLSAAFALCGDHRGAYEVYMKYVPEIQTEKDDKGKIKAWIDTDGGQKLTAAALITASVIELPEAECFARYLASGDKKYDLYALQLVVYLRNYVPEVKGDAVVTYTLNGAKQTVKPDRHFPATIEMTEEQFRNAGFEVTSGSVYALTRYIGRISENKNTPTLSVTKKISGSYTAGGELTVSLHAEPYTLIYDVIPCCGKFSGSGNGWCSAEGQLVTAYTDKDGNASYKFTANVSGGYVVESAVVYDRGTGEWGKCERTEITIK